jgi:predicted transcriptional regulator
MRKPYSEGTKQVAREMWAEGHTQAQIAKFLNVPPPSVARWTKPEIHERNKAASRAYKQRIRGYCIDCGARTAYRGKPGARVSKRCQACQRIYEQTIRKWTPETVVEAILKWTAEHGKRPSIKDWMQAGPDHPALSTTYSGKNAPFKSWGDALRAAGFTDVRTPPGPGNQLFDRDEARRLYKSGMSGTQIAELYGVSPSAIYQAFGRMPQRQNPKNLSREQRIAALQRAVERGDQ